MKGKFIDTSFKRISTNLLVYGFTHAVVDGCCAGIIFSLFRSGIFQTSEFVSLVLLYNVLAFGLQVIFGLIIDYLKTPKLAALSGCLLTVVAVIIFSSLPVFAIIFAGIGNALFHVGGGSISLNLTPKRASAPGIFVAPGALGLFLGTVLGKTGTFNPVLFILALVFLSFLMFLIRTPGMNYDQKIEKREPNYFELILFLVFLSVTIRSLIGAVIIFPWKTDLNLVTILILAIVLGKGLGGFLADKFGFMKIAVGALILSIPFLIFFPESPYLAIAGMFLFNITMPVTLVLISNMLPGRPGFAFGLTCLALLLGAIPAFTEFKQLLGEGGLILFIVSISTLALFFSLKMYTKDALIRQGK